MCVNLNSPFFPQGREKTGQWFFSRRAGLLSSSEAQFAAEDGAAEQEQTAATHPEGGWREFGASPGVAPRHYALHSVPSLSHCQGHSGWNRLPSSSRRLRSSRRPPIVTLDSRRKTGTPEYFQKSVRGAAGREVALGLAAVSGGLLRELAGLCRHLLPHPLRPRQLGAGVLGS